MRPDVKTQIQRTQGERKDRMSMAGETDHPLYRAFAMPDGQAQPLSKTQALVVTEIIKAVSVTTLATTANGDGTFTHTFSFPV